MAIQLYQITKDPTYLQRTKDLHNNFISQLQQIKGQTFGLIGKSFYLGWTVGTYNSCHMPSQPPSTDTLYEDLSHADTNLRFILASDKLLNSPSGVTISSLMPLVHTSPYTFSRFLSGNTTYQPPSLMFLPLSAFTTDPTIQQLYAKSLHLPYADFDQQAYFYAHVQAAANSMASSGTFIISQYTIDSPDFTLKPYKTIRINLTNNQCSSSLEKGTTYSTDTQEPCTNIIKHYFQANLKT